MNCQMLPSDPLPLFSTKNIPLYRRSPADILSKEYPPAPLRLRHRFQLLPAYQLLPSCESFNKPLLSGTHTSRTHTTHGQEKIPNSIMVIIIIMISIILIYIFILLTILCFFFWPNFLHKKKVFICSSICV